MEYAHEWWYENEAPKNVDDLSDVQEWELFSEWWKDQQITAAEIKYGL